jgi:hypothetical protein
MYFKVEQDSDNYIIMMTEKFYKYTTPYFNNSYFNIMYRLFNLLPKDFYHYVGFKYKAQFQKSKYLSNFVKMSFKKESDAKEFCKELNRRFHYCVERGDFA